MTTSLVGVGLCAYDVSPTAPTVEGPHDPTGSVTHVAQLLADYPTLLATEGAETLGTMHEAVSAEGFPCVSEASQDSEQRLESIRDSIPSAALPLSVAPVLDPAGDLILVDPSIPRIPDLTSWDLTVVGQNLRVTIGFHPRTLMRSTTQATVLLDMDQNPRTGSRGITSGPNPWDANLIGVEFLISMGAQFGGQPQGRALVRRFAGGGFSPGGTFQQTYGAKSIRVSVTLAVLGGDNGGVAFKVTSSVRLTVNSSTPIADVMPDRGLPPGRRAG